MAAGPIRTARDAREGKPMPAPNNDPVGAIQSFCKAAWLGANPPAAVMSWLAGCLADIEDDPNHPARPAFGISRRGRPPSNDSPEAKILLYVGLARRYGWKLEGAIEHAQRQFNKAESTVRKVVCGMRTHRRKGPIADHERLLLQLGVTLPPKPPQRRASTKN